MDIEEKNIWTIGHSTRDLEEFVTLLKSFDVTHLVDVRNYPGSKRYPHFNKGAMETSLPHNTISYTHLKDLGGRRTPKPHSVNSAWKNSAFRGYADYMETESFQYAIKVLEEIALKENTAYMCSEAVWWSCHRALISDCLKVRGWKVGHIMSISKATEHPFTKPARLVDGVLTYSLPGLF
jgi:uncharacterized protein (DUF488 family)